MTDHCYCPDNSCKCEVEAKFPKCKVDLNCALKVATQAKLSIIGNYKVYLIEVVLKNCTKELLQYVSASLDIGCSSFLITDEFNSPPCTSVVGLDELSEQFRDERFKNCIDGGQLPVNELWNGVDELSGIYGINRTELFAQPTPGKAGCCVVLPPGESRLKIRIIANVSSCDFFIDRPILTVSASVPCCGPVRISQSVNTGECVPEYLPIETCEPGLLPLLP